MEFTNDMWTMLVLAGWGDHTRTQAIHLRVGMERHVQMPIILTCC